VKIRLDALDGLLVEPNIADAAGIDHLVIDCTGCSAPDASTLQRMHLWCTCQPIPLIVLSDHDGCHALDDVCDVVVETETALAQVLAGIHARPMAASVLVQVLRAQQHLAVAQALTVESMGYATLLGGTEFDAWLAHRDARYATGKPAALIPVLIEQVGNRVELILNHPENRNALSASMRDALSDALRLVLMDAAVESVHLRGNGPCFSAGGDLSEFGALRDLALGHRIRALRMPAQYLAACADRVSVHLHGACIGAGIELPAFAHHVTAAPGTVFRLPEIAMGLIPGAGGCVSIPRRIGRQRTAFMALSDADIGVDTALAWGLIDAITPGVDAHIAR
jgi:enoyl-CoA hydratase